MAVSAVLNPSTLAASSSVVGTPITAGFTSTTGSFSTRTMLTPSRPRNRRIADRAGGTAKAMPIATAAATTATATTRSHRRAGRWASLASIPGQRSRSPGKSTYAATAPRSRSSSATVVLPHFGAKLLERTRQPRFDRSAAHAERRRRLLFCELEQVPACQHETVVLPQPVQRREQLPAPLCRDERGLGGRGRVPRGRVRRGAQHEPLPPPGRAAAVPGLVGDDAEQPGPEGGVGPEPAERAVSLDEPVLGGFLRIGLVPGDQVRSTECDCLMCAHELLVCGRVAPLRAGDELRLGKWPAHHHGNYTGR